MVDIAVARTEELTGPELTALRELLEVAFDGRFEEADWQHTIGGLHVVARAGAAEIVSHAAVVPRRLAVDDRRLAAGYVEGVATQPHARGRGYATRVMERVSDVIRAVYELGALSADVPALYAAVGWEPWRGATYVDAPNGRRRTPDDDDGVMVLRTPRTGELDLAADITCDWRAGDVW